jgi:RNA recognition motif-containing protein
MSKDLYVTHLPPEYGEAELHRLFSVAGTVSYIHLVTDPQTGESKGCAYVKMASEREAREGIDCLDGARIEGHTLSVRVALPQKPKAPGPAGGPGRKPFKPRGGGSGSGPKGHR